jgi:hypothetical protein
VEDAALTDAEKVLVLSGTARTILDRFG